MLFLSRHPTILFIGFPLLVLVGMLVTFEVGRRMKLRSLARDPEGAGESLRPVEGAIFGLLGLLIAFTFAGAATRYDARRTLTVQEAQALGNASRRLDMLPADLRVPIRNNLRRFVESRLETYRRLPDLAAAREELERSIQIQDEIWEQAVSACSAPERLRLSTLILPALEHGFDMTLVRTAKAMHHPPLIIWGMLFLMALASALVAGHGATTERRPNRTYILAFAATTAFVVYAVLDIEFPRAGLVQVTASDGLLEDVLQRMP